MNMKMIATAAVLALGSMATSASALTILSKNGFYSDGVQGLVTGNSISFDFQASEDLRVLDFLSVTGNGGNGGNDIAKAQFGYTGATITDVMRHFAASEITVNGATATGQASLDGFVLSAGDTFSVDFAYDPGGTFTIDMDFSFVTAAVPVPAAGFLLLGGLGGLAALRRRKDKAKA